MVPFESALPFHRQPLARNNGGYAGLFAEIFLVNRKTNDFKNIADKTWSSFDAGVRDVSGRSKKLNSRVKPGNDEQLGISF